MGLFGRSEPERSEMSFFEHLDALRPRLLRSGAVLLLLAVLCFACRELLVTVVTGPESPWFPTNRFFGWLAERMSSESLRINSRPLVLINTEMAGQFNLHLSMSLFGALILGVPYVLWELWGFVKPALTESELRASRRIVLYVTLCFFTGVAFGYFVLCPLSVNFLSNYEVGGQIANMIEIGSYVSLVTTLPLVCGVVFLLPVVVWILSRAGLLTAAFMRRYRRHALLFLSIGAAIITPPDVASMVLVLVPMYGLYELSIGIAVRGERGQA